MCTKQAVEPMDVAAKQASDDKLHLLHALWRISKGLRKQVKGVRDLISMVEEVDTSNLHVVLPVLGQSQEQPPGYLAGLLGS